MNINLDENKMYGILSVKQIEGHRPIISIQIKRLYYYLYLVHYWVQLVIEN